MKTPPSHAPPEFPKLEAGSLRRGFAVIFRDKVRIVQEVDKRRTTISITFSDGYEETVLHEKIVEVVVKNRKERKAKNVRSNKRKPKHIPGR